MACRLTANNNNLHHQQKEKKNKNNILNDATTANDNNKRNKNNNNKLNVDIKESDQERGGECQEEEKEPVLIQDGSRTCRVVNLLINSRNKS